jgi:hypothetical protein
MLNPHILSPNTIDWLAQQALNELNGYLCDGRPHVDNGDEWPEMARKLAEQCRAVACAAGDESEKKTWLDVADQYEQTINVVSPATVPA